MKKDANEVDDYIAQAPKKVKRMLQELRVTITETAPTAIERISYGMPYYDYHGRLAYFRPAKTHLGLYIPSPVIEEHKRELRNYETTKATICLPMDKPLPIALIKKLIKARMKINEMSKKK